MIGDPSEFHTYALEWTPQSMAFLYDGTTCLVDHWNAASPLVDPEPFNQPFYICLTQALGIGMNLFIPGSTPLPATTSVDWVRVWGILLRRADPRAEGIGEAKPQTPVENFEAEPAGEASGPGGGH